MGKTDIAPGYDKLMNAVSEMCNNIRNVVREAVETAYRLGQHDAAQQIGKSLLGLDRKEEMDVEEFVRKLWEEGQHGSTGDV